MKLNLLKPTKGTLRQLTTTLVGIVFLALSLAVNIAPSNALAQALKDCDEKKLRAMDISITNCTGDSPCDVAASAIGGGTQAVLSGKSVYIVGDSITVGSSGELESQITTGGGSISKISASVGRHITSGGDDGISGLQAVQNDSTEISAADIVIIALGTNPNGANESGVTDMISAIKNTNATASIYWVNLFSPEAGNKDTFNQLLTDLSASLGFTVISTTGANIEVSDGLHPVSGTGTNAFASAVLAGLRGSVTTSTTAAGCTCSAVGNGTPEENERNVWAYFTSTQGLSPEATAGIMGSIAPESGFDPQNMQNTAPLPDGPEFPVDPDDPTQAHPQIRGKFGYGLIQWTSEGRQANLIAFGREQNRSTGSLGLQLDFLWKELNEGYQGVVALLQTPGVTVREASDEVTLRFVTPGSVTREHGTPATRAATLRDRGNQAQAFFDKYSGQSISFSGGAGCNTSGTNIDLESTDTTNIPCPSGLQDLGTDELGYRNGQEVRLRLCEVGGTKVNSQIADSIRRLLADSAAAGVGLALDGAGGSFRDMQGQIDTYNRWCASRGVDPTPPPYPKASWSDYARCRGASPPGYSNHQTGLGFDFVCDGALIPETYAEAQSNPCFQWLLANASNYGLYEFGRGESRGESGYEGWHWSVDGN